MSIRLCKNKYYGFELISIFVSHERRCVPRTEPQKQQNATQVREEKKV
jgi:hypothetical protein